MGIGDCRLRIADSEIPIPQSALTWASVALWQSDRDDRLTFRESPVHAESALARLERPSGRFNALAH